MCMEHAQFARVMSHAAPPPAPRDNGPDPAPAASACPGGTYASEPRVGTRPPYVDHADAGWRVGAGINEPPLARGEFTTGRAVRRVAESAVTTHVTFTVPPDRVSRSGRGRPPRLGTAGGTNGTT